MRSPCYPSRAMTKHELPTPALLVDLDRFERNVARWPTT